MNDIFDNLKELILSFFNNENYINLISIFVVAFTTYRVTKFTVLKPDKQKLKQSQLEYVYLPLFLVFNEMPEKVNRLEAISYSKKLKNILSKNYILAFPQLHRLNKTLEADIIINGNFNKTLHAIKYQVDIDYELLKKTLGYPSESSYDIFLRMAPKQKLSCILTWFNAFYLFIPCITSFVFRRVFGKYLIIFIFLQVLLLSILIYKLNQFVKAMDD